MKKKILPVVLTVTMILSMVFSTGASAYAAVQVTDITGHRSETAIRQAIGLGVIKGYPDGTFRPDGLIKREEFFSIINNILTTRPMITNTKLNFIDVDPIEWYIPVVKTMVEAKITSGIGWEKVGIGLNITRQEAIKILATIIPTRDLPATSVEILASDKANISTWAVSSYQIMLKKGYLKNTTGALGPGEELTREEAAILLLKIKLGETIISGNPNAALPAVVVTGGCISTASHAAINGAFLKGKGTQTDPYQVSTQEQLNHVRAHLTEGAFFVMTNDIKVTKDFETTIESFLSATTDWSNGNFQPIGTKTTPFEGTFSGGGYKIEGLNILGTVQASDLANARELASNVGLFGCLGSKSVISNLGIINSQIYGKDYTGGIVGYNDGTVKNSGIGENTIIKGGSFTGGIAGYSSNWIQKCFSSGSITGKTGAGALVGKNYGTLRDSYWLTTSYPEAVGVSGMNSAILEVKLLSSLEFVNQNIEQFLKQKV